MYGLEKSQVPQCGVWDPGFLLRLLSRSRRKKNKKEKSFFMSYFIPEKERLKSNSFEIKYIDASACAGEE
jgi:hypothetical protein